MFRLKPKIPTSASLLSNPYFLWRQIQSHFLLGSDGWLLVNLCLSPW